MVNKPVAPKQVPVQQAAPAPQPIAPKHHSHAGLWILSIIFILATLVLVVVAVLLFRDTTDLEIRRGDVATQLEDVKEQLQTEKVALQEAENGLEQLQKSIPPILYGAWTPENGHQLIKINRETGSEEVIATADSVGYFVFAIPQIGYKGDVILSRTGEGDDPGYSLQLFNVENSEESLQDHLSSIPGVREAVVVSPEQRRIVAAYDNPILGETQKELVIIDLFSGEKEVIGTIADDEFFARITGSNTFGGASEFDLNWVSFNCVRASIYEDSFGPEGEVLDVKNFKEYRTFCAE